MKPIVPNMLLKLYYETARQKVVEVLFKYPDREFSLSDLAKVAGVAKAHIGKVLNDFNKLGLIDITKLSKIWRIRAKMDNPLYIKNKIIYNLNLVYQSGLVEQLITDFNNPKAIVLFGSFRKGEDISGSDIDIAIETDEDIDYQTFIFKEETQLEKQIERKIQIHKFNRKKIDINVFNNIANGILLSGFLEVRP
ncbi:MAG: hypothetical protein QS98_C0006G0006 [archaeon GW2011_AR3]|nr:MAG: hypothetical protein QS98_C0006G0006 [archaeon GW2011_AR3]MBS3109232.1 nucleotidyltransferase domain-containing protein [Candidatus Woesearchaeota archaeon]